MFFAFVFYVHDFVDDWVKLLNIIVCCVIAKFHDSYVKNIQHNVIPIVIVKWIGDFHNTKQN